MGTRVPSTIPHAETDAPFACYITFFLGIGRITFKQLNRSIMGFLGDEEAADEVPAISPFRYNSPLLQVCLTGLLCFCCPGMGGGNQVDATAANNANTALYTSFLIFRILGGDVYNIFGPKITLAMGCSTYVLYVDSFLYYNHDHDQTFDFIAGALLGNVQAFLWAGQGAINIMTSYPTTPLVVKAPIFLSAGLFSTWAASWVDSYLSS
ncbi:hypothetical protein V6N13_146698 [Hibiscus sabdariffa]|uniref:Uncharacterized protein n=1 Tax=Hibiscus sabdariffa TaxID=183260 RepID=A0ABR2TU62_9ROSI